MWESAIEHQSQHKQCIDPRKVLYKGPGPHIDKTGKLNNGQIPKQKLAHQPINRQIKEHGRNLNNRRIIPQIHKKEVQNKRKANPHEPLPDRPMGGAPENETMHADPRERFQELEEHLGAAVGG